MGLARGRVSFRRLGLRHAAGTGPAAVAAWIHQSKFILGFSEKMLDQHGASNQAPTEINGARERLFERIVRIAQLSHPDNCPRLRAVFSDQLPGTIVKIS
jgi:hypothetical protein